MTNFDLLLRLCLQLAVILAASRIIGIIGRFLGQAQAVCDMLTGVLLGPSLFGLLAPTAQQWLFPMKAVLATGAATLVITHPSMGILYVIAQLGIALYMFLVGLEFDVRLLRGQSRAAGLVSFSGIAMPFALGAALYVALTQQSEVFGGELPALFGAGVTPIVALLFLCISLSITAFPVLARILQEHGLAASTLGTLAIGAAAVGDAVAWILLAILLAIAAGSIQIGMVTLVGTALYIAVMVTLARKAFQALVRRADKSRRDVSPQLLAGILCFVLLCSWYTSAIGIHQIFGAFIAGAIVPRGWLSDTVRGKLEPLTVALFLPIFFVYSGLNTQIGLVDSPQLWLLLGVIILCAVVGKGLACLVAARVSGQSWRASATLGVLMNSRGLIELILLNIGLELGLITPTLFTILVLMAIITTALTTPLFRALYSKPSLPTETGTAGDLAAA